MLLRHENFDLMRTLAEENTGMFVALAELAQVHRRKDATRFVVRAFGDEWPKLYAEARARSHVEVPPPR